MKKLFVVTSINLIICFFCCCSGVKKDSTVWEGEKLHRLFSSYDQWLMNRSPELAHFFGYGSKAGEMDDYSLKGIEEDHLVLLKEKEKLQAIDRSLLSERDKLYYDLFKLHLEYQLNGHQFKGYLRPINQLPGSIHLDLSTLHTFLVFVTEKNYHDFLSQLSHIPRIIDEVIERMELGLNEKITYPKEACHAVEGQLASILAYDPSSIPLFKPFKNMPRAFSDETKKKLRRLAKEKISEKVIPAFRKLHEFWTAKYYPRCSDKLGLSSLPNGEKWYRYLTKFYTTTDLTPDQIHRLGLKEVARLRGEMNQIIKDTGFKGTFAEFVNFLKTDPQFYYSSAEEFLTAFRALCKKIDPELPKIIGKLPRLPYGVRSISAEESAGQGGYVDLGNIKQGRASYLAISTHNLKLIKKYQMVSIILHEMVPGHHLQFSLIMEEEDEPAFRKLDNYRSYTEGWALYSEGLGYELGLYTDPYSRFGQLDMNMLRALRLVVDTGIHVKGWTRKKAMDYFKANSSWDDHFIQTEVDRYIVNPGQAVSYKIGELEFLRLRRLAEQELGEKFDVRNFHDVVLKHGSIPLNILAEIVNRYISEKKKQK